MSGTMISQCPICKGKLDVTRLQCSHCNTSIEGRFDSCKFCQLSNEQKYFLEIFVKSRGNIKEVEKELDISYPTVRSRLDSIIESLGYKPESEEENQQNRRGAILEDLENGKISSEEAIKLLKQK